MTARDEPLTTPHEMGLIIGALACAYPETSVVAETHALWQRHLQHFSMDVLLEAVDRWTVAHERMPKINQMIDTCRTVVSARMAGESWNVLDQPVALVEYEGEVHTYAAAISLALAKAREPWAAIEHNHFGGHERCPLCSRRDEIAREVTRRFRELTAHMHGQPVPT